MQYRERESQERGQGAARNALLSCVSHHSLIQKKSVISHQTLTTIQCHSNEMSWASSYRHSGKSEIMFATKNLQYVAISCHHPALSTAPHAHAQKCHATTHGVHPMYLHLIQQEYKRQYLSGPVFSKDGVSTRCTHKEEYTRVYTHA